MNATIDISVIVPTYRRPDVLVGCLRALHAQSHEPLEVLVSYRSDDTATATAIASLPDSERRLVRAVLLRPGDNLACGLRNGVAASRGQLVALTDDDAEAPADWLERLAARFDDPRVGGVGGRDLIDEPSRPALTVGRLQWFGRMIGNHHAGQGDPREVDFLKGVNCCFRGDVLRDLGVDTRLVGAGNVVHWELAICLPLKRAGWRLIYDPAITLVHHAAPRQDGDDNHRGGFNADALRDMVHNETLVLFDQLGPVQRAAYLAWGTLMGVGITPGVAQSLRAVLTGRETSSQALRRWRATQLGRVNGLRTWWRDAEDQPLDPQRPALPEAKRA
ncbi:N-glycosyltransferase [Botrimarina colliarenosi]|uniref:N-glycosyltransferase n=1 Tax=Botrimarina colliarenosi TaxID=2528001 RepID=A0A5C6AEV4_9BACT|nr:glycosyltransferase [Botrimarina colliarenosi]TWT97966.1 N-glycosyltransferase [Botrimarina colliarenosi]